MLTGNLTSPEEDKERKKERKKVLHSVLQKSNFGLETISLSFDEFICTT